MGPGLRGLPGWEVPIWGGGGRPRLKVRVPTNPIRHSREEARKAAPPFSPNAKKARPEATNKNEKMVERHLAFSLRGSDYRCPSCTVPSGKGLYIRRKSEEHKKLIYFSSRCQAKEQLFSQEQVARVLLRDHLLRSAMECSLATGEKTNWEEKLFACCVPNQCISFRCAYQKHIYFLAGYWEDK
eukprot:gene5307-3809_t